MLLLLVPTVLAAGLPEVSVSWKKDIARLEVHGPTGEHVQRAAPARGWLDVDGRRLEFSADGAALVDGVAFLAPGERRLVQGELTLSLCEDGGSLCRIAEVAFLGTLDGRKGELRFAVREPDTDGGEAVHATGADEAFAAAAAEGKLVLLDFGAVWCPPCNLLAAEILHDPGDAEALAGFALAAVDVDLPDSWALKDRYHVGGYPTVVIARSDGAEVDRLVGYPGEAETLAWLAGVDSRPALADLPTPDAVTPEAAAALAARLAKAQRPDDAAAFLRRAEGVQSADAHLARLLLQPAEADALWLVEHDRAHLSEWLWSALSLGTQPGSAVSAPLLDAVRVALVDAEGAEASDLQYAVARLVELNDPIAARLLYASGAATLSAALSGDVALDRGHLTDLADLQAAAGDLDAARATLERGIAAWPHDFTFYYALAGVYVDAERFAEALPFAVAALPLSYGDNRLRAAHRLAKAMAGIGEKQAALDLVTRTLAEADVPEEGLDVRTPRYIKALEELRGGLLAE